MKTKKLLKQFFCASVLAFVALVFSPALSLAASPAWGVSLDNNGNLGVGIGSSASAIAATNGSYGGFSGGGWTLTNPYGLPSGSILGIISNLLFWLLAIFAVAGIVGFVLSGIFYLLAGADEGNAEKGKNGMTWSIIGIIVGLSGFVIMQAVASLLGGASKNF